MQGEKGRVSVWQRISARKDGVQRECTVSDEAPELREDRFDITIEGVIKSSDSFLDEIKKALNPNSVKSGNNLTPRAGNLPPLTIDIPKEEEEPINSTCPDYEKEIMSIIEYLNCSSSEIKDVCNTFKRLVEIERNHSRLLIKFAQTQNFGDNYIHKTAKDAICSALSAVKTVAMERLDYSNSLDIFCDSLLELSKTAKKESKINRDVFNPDKKQVIDSENSMTKAKTRYEASLNELESYKSTNEKLNSSLPYNSSVISIFRRPSTLDKAEEAKARISHLYDDYQIKLKYSTECKSFFVNVRAPHIHENIKKLSTDLVKNYSTLLEKIVNEVIKQSKRNHCSGSCGRGSFIPPNINIKDDFEKYTCVSHSHGFSSEPLANTSARVKSHIAARKVTPTFNISLEVLPTYKDTGVPLIVEKCTRHIEEHGIDLVGIYRIPGPVKDIASLKARIDLGESIDSILDFSPQNIHTITGLIKAFFRNIPGLLISPLIYAKLSNALEINNHKLRTLEMAKILSNIPKSSYNTLKHIILHLKKIANNSEVNNMNCENIAIIWGPNLVESKSEDAMTQMTDVGTKCKIIKTLIEAYEDIFTSDESIDLLL